MSILRRRRLSGDLAEAERRFEDTLVHVERAKDAVTAAVPVARVAPVSLAEALFGFEAELIAAGAGMDAWRIDELADEWSSCRDGIEEAHARAEAIRLEAPAMGFESLVEVIGDLIAPLEPFEETAERFVELRR
jgi:hypothetical protein